MEDKTFHLIKEDIKGLEAVVAWIWDVYHSFRCLKNLVPAGRIFWRGRAIPEEECPQGLALTLICPDLVPVNSLLFDSF